MMSFEKEFPSIKKIYVIDDETASVYITDVMKCCLDKQRVKEAIENLQDKYDLLEHRTTRLEPKDRMKMLAKVKILEELSKELGLGDE